MSCFRRKHILGAPQQRTIRTHLWTLRSGTIDDTGSHASFNTLSSRDIAVVTVIMVDLAPSIVSLPQIALATNSHPSATLDEQAGTEQLIKTLLETTASLDGTEPTVLRKREHSTFLAGSLFQLPAPYVSLDASKPWLLFWTLQSLDILGVPVDNEVKKR